MKSTISTFYNSTQKMTESKVTGQVTNYHKKEGMPAGIKVNETWYNATDRTEQYLNKELQAKTVELTLQDNKITFLRVVEGNKEIATTSSPSTTPNTNGKPLGVTIGMAMNNANLRVNTMPAAVTSEKEWAKLVVSYTKALLDEMEKEGLT